MGLGIKKKKKEQHLSIYPLQFYANPTHHSPECLLQLHALFSGFVPLLVQLGLQRLHLWQDGTAQASITHLVQSTLAPAIYLRAVTALSFVPRLPLSPRDQRSSPARPCLSACRCIVLQLSRCALHHQPLWPWWRLWRQAAVQVLRPLSKNMISAWSWWPNSLRRLPVFSF